MGKSMDEQLKMFDGVKGLFGREDLLMRSLASAAAPLLRNLEWAMQHEFVLIASCACAPFSCPCSYWPCRVIAE